MVQFWSQCRIALMFSTTMAAANGFLLSQVFLPLTWPEIEGANPVEPSPTRSGPPVPGHSHDVRGSHTVLPLSRVTNMMSLSSLSLDRLAYLHQNMAIYGEK